MQTTEAKTGVPLPAKEGPIVSAPHDAKAVDAASRQRQYIPEGDPRLIREIMEH